MCPSSQPLKIMAVFSLANLEKGFAHMLQGSQIKIRNLQMVQFLLVSQTDVIENKT
jgi:hypothetical protein